MLRLFVALGAVLTAAGATSALLSPSAPHGLAVSAPVTTTPENTTTVEPSYVRMPPPTPASCYRPAPPPVPRDLRAAYDGDLDPQHSVFEVRFPVVDAIVLSHAIVRFDAYGTSLGAHHAQLLDGEGRTLQENDGQVLAIERAPASGTFLARFVADAPVSEHVHATVDVHYDSTAAWQRGDPWTFALKLPGPGAQARLPLDVQGAWPSSVKIGWDASAPFDVEIALYDEYGNAIRTQRAQGFPSSAPSGASWELPLGASAVGVRDLGASPPQTFHVLLVTTPEPVDMAYLCM